TTFHGDYAFGEHEARFLGEDLTRLMMMNRGTYSNRVRCEPHCPEIKSRGRQHDEVFCDKCGLHQMSVAEVWSPEDLGSLKRFPVHVRAQPFLRVDMDGPGGLRGLVNLERIKGWVTTYIDTGKRPFGQRPNDILFRFDPLGQGWQTLPQKPCPDES